MRGEAGDIAADGLARHYPRFWGFLLTQRMIYRDSSVEDIRTPVHSPSSVAAVKASPYDFASELYRHPVHFRAFNVVVAIRRFAQPCLFNHISVLELPEAEICCESSPHPVISGDGCHVTPTIILC